MGGHLEYPIKPKYDFINVCCTDVIIVMRD